MGETANPRFIVLARESRGLTQSELAKATAISQGKISKIENGVFPASEELLDTIARVLRYPRDFFLQDDEIFGLGPNSYYHRKRQSLSARALAKIHAVVNIRRIHVARLLKVVDFGKCQIPRIALDEYDNSPEEVARVVRESWILKPGPVENLVKTIEGAGGIVIKTDFGTRLLDALSMWPPNSPPLFFLNVDIPADRARFSMAHELGHMVMHSIPYEEMEPEADRFAAEFLVPEKDVSQSFSTVNLPRLAMLKPHWKVSMQCLLKRAAQVKRITVRQERNLWMQMGAAGYRTREPGELDVAPEEPTILPGLFRLHQEDLGYSPSELGRILHYFEDELSATYGVGARRGLSIVRGK